MSDIKEGITGGENMGSDCCGSTCRSFLTKDEKVEKLKEYQEAIEKEAQGVKERIQELEK